MRKKHFVAVYGTLKNGKPNHSLMALIGAEFVGAAKTIEKYPLICGGGLPYLFENIGVGHRVNTEVYKVDDDGLKILDHFEEHPDFYIRKPCECELQNGEKRVCFIYFINKKRTDFGEFTLQKNC